MCESESAVQSAHHSAVCKSDEISLSVSDGEDQDLSTLWLLPQGLLALILPSPSFHLLVVRPHLFLFRRGRTTTCNGQSLCFRQFTRDCSIRYLLLRTYETNLLRTYQCFNSESI